MGGRARKRSHDGRMFVVALGVTACSSMSSSAPSPWNSGDPGDLQRGVPSANEMSGGAAGTGNTEPTAAADAGGVGTDVRSTGGTATSSAGGTLAFVGGRGNDVVGAGGILIAPGGLGNGAGGGGSGGTSSAAGGTSSNAGGSSSGLAGATNGNSGKCTFSFDVTTVTARGRFAPHNVGAIWISDPSNKFVKTLRYWGTVELQQATAWTRAAAGNKVDAVSGATRVAHGPLTASWNCTDVSEAPVSDGNYAVHVTFTESDANPFAPGPAIEASVPFTKSAGGADVTAQDTANFTAMHLKLSVP
jgi:hypothetical protein